MFFVMNSPTRIKKVLITGMSGSGGSYLAEYILENHKGVEVHGTFRRNTPSALRNLENIMGRAKIYECDLLNREAVSEMYLQVSPDTIFHLASDANVRISWDTPLETIRNNVEGTINLFEAIRNSGQKPLVQLCSTSEVYGQVDPKNVPITEDCPIQPCNPYSVSKLAQDSLGLTYFMGFEIPVIRTRMFSYINPRRSDLFATSFAMQVARIEAGLQKELIHGNLNSTRTLIDVRDAMESYWIAAKYCRPGEIYNIGGIEVITVGDFLEKLKNISNCKIPSRIDPKLIRPVDVTLQVPCVDKFTRETGWKPKYKFDESVKYLLDNCREIVQRQLNHKSQYA